MRRVFLDTNILLDFALEREHAEEAEKILALGSFLHTFILPAPQTSRQGFLFLPVPFLLQITSPCA